MRVNELEVGKKYRIVGSCGTGTGIYYVDKKVEINGFNKLYPVIAIFDGQPEEVRVSSYIDFIEVGDE